MSCKSGQHKPKVVTGGIAAAGVYKCEECGELCTRGGEGDQETRERIAGQRTANAESSSEPRLQCGCTFASLSCDRLGPFCSTCRTRFHTCPECHDAGGPCMRCSPEGRPLFDATLRAQIDPANSSSASGVACGAYLRHLEAGAELLRMFRWFDHRSETAELKARDTLLSHLAQMVSPLELDRSRQLKKFIVQGVQARNKLVSEKAHESKPAAGGPEPGQETRMKRRELNLACGHSTAHLRSDSGHEFCAACVSGCPPFKETRMLSCGHTFANLGCDQHGPFCQICRAEQEQADFEKMRAAIASSAHTRDRARARSSWRDVAAVGAGLMILAVWDRPALARLVADWIDDG